MDNILEKTRREKMKIFEEVYECEKTQDLKDFTEATDSFTSRGRIIFKRDLGKLIFLKVNDLYNIVQIAIQSSVENFEKFKTLDLGDIIYFSGNIFFTQAGEKTVNTNKIKLLKKALLPLPDKHSGLQDEESKLRKRYIDMIQNHEIKNILLTRSKVFNAIKKYLESLGFLQVETPILQPIASGAMANPFETHHNTLDSKLFLRIAPELYLKRLIIGGCNKIFEIAKCFRNEGMDKTHLQEFSMLELYEAYISYEDLQNLALNLLNTIGQEFQSNIFKNIPRYSYIEFLKKYGLDFKEMQTYEDLKKKAIDLNLEWEKYPTYQGLLDLIYKKVCVKNIDDPILVYDYPKSALAKISDKDSNFSSQFQIIWKKQEIVKACLEMIDPDQQLKNFEEQAVLEKDDKDVVRTDSEFIEALKYGMPPTGGLGLGLDRFITLLTNSESIRDVIIFPITKNINI